MHGSKAKKLSISTRATTAFEVTSDTIYYVNLATQISHGSRFESVSTMPARRTGRGYSSDTFRSGNRRVIRVEAPREQPGTARTSTGEQASRPTSGAREQAVEADRPGQIVETRGGVSPADLRRLPPIVDKPTHTTPPKQKESNIK